jgi:hypothetical protein
MFNEQNAVENGSETRFFPWDHSVMVPKLSGHLKNSTGKEKPDFSWVIDQPFGVPDALSQSCASPETRFFLLGSECHGSQALWASQEQHGQRKTGFLVGH